MRYGGLWSISKSEVSRTYADLDEEVAAFRDRPLTRPFLYVGVGVQRGVRPRRVRVPLAADSIRSR